MITLLAGRFTPEDRVDVATNTRTTPFRNAASTMSRSSRVNPAWWKATPKETVLRKTPSKPTGQKRSCSRTSPIGSGLS
jgi:hypothetical protein